MDLVEKVKELCLEFKEENLAKAIERFATLTQGIEKTRGEAFAKAGIYGFLEGILTTLKMKYSDEKIETLLHEVKTAREEAEALLRKPKPPLLVDNDL
ncbi:MAG: hypothetical protein PWP39_539 [Pyrococcus sp.]|uniref:DUF3216 domain-containing protein n=1 Tax=Pyrococcus sp. TaxID=33866 RepID=UPI002585CCD0|nr:DUF3216 domain-containing protein [Pyrococcus sp.]MDK2869304.1 hypothetical protein [Pyrococcus sp.]